MSFGTYVSDPPVNTDANCSKETSKPTDAKIPKTSSDLNPVLST